MTPIEALYQRVRTSPNGVAFIVGDDKWKYGWLAAQAERVARGLAGRAIRKGDRIALRPQIRVPNSARALVIFVTQDPRMQTAAYPSRMRNQCVNS